MWSFSGQWCTFWPPGPHPRASCVALLWLCVCVWVLLATAPLFPHLQREGSCRPQPGPILGRPSLPRKFCLGGGWVVGPVFFEVMVCERRCGEVSSKPQTPPRTHTYTSIPSYRLFTCSHVHTPYTQICAQIYAHAHTSHILYNAYTFTYTHAHAYLLTHTRTSSHTLTLLHIHRVTHTDTLTHMHTHTHTHSHTLLVSYLLGLASLQGSGWWQCLCDMPLLATDPQVRAAWKGPLWRLSG